MPEYQKWRGKKTDSTDIFSPQFPEDVVVTRQYINNTSTTPTNKIALYVVKDDVESLVWEVTADQGDYNEEPLGLEILKGEVLKLVSEQKLEYNFSFVQRI